MGLNKRGQVMHMPFQMIFSLMLIAIFLVVAFFVIMNFLNVQNCAQVGLFQRDLQDKITSIWNSQEAEQTFESNLPTSVKYICFLNFTRAKVLTGLNSEQRQIADQVYDDLEVYYKNKKADFFLYPVKSGCNMAYKWLAHIDTNTVPNPYCIANSGKVRIKLYKSFDDVSVKVRQ